jgi:ABC-type transport system involved in multi-copper enzyme maturation permease subunit
MSNIVSSPVPEQAQPSGSIVLGHRDAFSVVMRSTAAELYKIRRRLMSKIFLFIGIPMVILLFSFYLLVGALSSAYGGSSTTCTTGSNGQQMCTTQQLTAERKERQRESNTRDLRLPNSFTTAGGIASFLSLIFLSILAGTIVGGEYSAGTIRLMLTRGPTRTEFFLAKILALLISAFLFVLILIPIGILAGALFNLVFGIGVNFNFFTGEWVLHALLFFLLEVLNVFVFAMIALCFSTLGRNPAAGIAAALVWWVLENILTSVLRIIGISNPGQVGDVLKAIPNFFVGNDVSALLTHQSDILNGVKQITAPVTDSQYTIPEIVDWVALIVIAVYLIVFIGSGWWTHQSRDVTN